MSIVNDACCVDDVYGTAQRPQPAGLTTQRGVLLHVVCPMAAL